MRRLIISLFLLAVFLAEIPVYAEEGARLDNLLKGGIQDLAPALEAMRRHKTLLEEKLGKGNFSDEAESNVAAFPPSSKSEFDRDPFATTPLMEQKGSQVGGSDFKPLPSGLKTPELKLRGIVSGADGERVALLDVSGTDVYLVREGDTISLHSIGRNTVIKVEKVGHLSLTVSVGTLGEVVIVR